jgi:hypothetical protein
MNNEKKVIESIDNAGMAIVVGSVLRPKNGHELLRFLKEKKKCEVVDTYAFLAAKALEDNNCGFSFSFKKSNWNKGWASFERS